MADAMEEYEYEDGDEMEYIEIREQDRFLPIANIARIMKKVLPNNAKIAKDAKESIQECVSEFISFITSEASEKCQQEKRKTINGDDILWAMSTLGFDQYVEPLKIYLLKYRDSVKGEKPDKKSMSSKKNSESSAAQPKKSMHESQYHPMTSSYNHPTQSAGAGSGVSYSSYGSVTNNLPSSGMAFLVDHAPPLVAPSKGEHVHLALPPPPPMTLQPPPSHSLSLSSIPPLAPSFLQQQQHQHQQPQQLQQQPQQLPLQQQQQQSPSLIMASSPPTSLTSPPMPLSRPLPLPLQQPTSTSTSINHTNHLISPSLHVPLPTPQSLPLPVHVKIEPHAQALVPPPPPPPPTSLSQFHPPQSNPLSGDSSSNSSSSS